MTTPAHREPDRELVADASDLARILAFYLPQYHAIPENDAWWGPGFTDWANVNRARSLFAGHDQPRVPAGLGSYDLLDLETHHAQANLARAHGIAGFCYYAYWFSGRRLLEQPLQIVAEHPELAFPYAICWANEPWSRRWDGSEGEVLMAQNHSAMGDAAFIDDMAIHLGDPRYVRVAGKPLLLVYRASLLDDAKRTTDTLRERAQALGLGELFLAMVQSFGAWDPVALGFDGAVEFPPHPHNLGHGPRDDVEVPGRVEANGPWTPRMETAIQWFLSPPAPDFAWFRTVMPGFDNTPRRGTRGLVYVGSTPRAFREWLEQALEWTYLFRPPAERLVFVNAWNEWAEGAYLEPDVSNGSAYLQAVSDALLATRVAAADASRMWAGWGRVGELGEAQGQWTARTRRSADNRGTVGSLVGLQVKRVIRRGKQIWRGTVAGR